MTLSHGTLILYGALFSALVIALRILWIFPGAFLAYKIRSLLLHQKVTMPALGGMLVVGWAGMRGGNRARRGHRAASNPGGWKPFPAS